MNIGVGFIPGIGDARDAIAASVAGAKGDYTTAGLLAAGVMLPFSTKMLKPLKRYITGGDITKKMVDATRSINFT